MMVLPFVGFAGAMCAVLMGRRAIAVGLWSVSIIGTLGLFAVHATDTLPLSF